MNLSELARTVCADLQVQAMMFNMDIDWETLSLEPKREEVIEPLWLTRWKEKREHSDFNEYFDIDWE